MCSSLRVCMGSPDQSWFLQGSPPPSTQDPTQVPFPALTCGTSFQDAPTSAELTFMQPPLPLARGLTPICLNERFQTAPIHPIHDLLGACQGCSSRSWVFGVVSWVLMLPDAGGEG